MSNEADEQAGPKYDRCASATGLLISIPAGAWRSPFWGTSMSEKPFHEAANVFPLLQGEQLKALADDIAENGLQEAIWLHEDGSILDGRNRFRACKIAGVEPRFQTYEGSDPLGFVLSLNLHRRHLTSAQKAALAVDVEAYEAEAAKQRQGTRTDITEKIPESEFSESREKAAQKVGTNPRYVSDAKRIKKDAWLIVTDKTVEEVLPSTGSVTESVTVVTMANDAWQVIGTAITESTLALAESPVPKNGTPVPFTEYLLRDIVAQRRGL